MEPRTRGFKLQEIGRKVMQRVPEIEDPNAPSTYSRVKNLAINSNEFAEIMFVDAYATIISRIGSLQEMNFKDAFKWLSEPDRLKFTSEALYNFFSWMIARLKRKRDLRERFWAQLQRALKNLVESEKWECLPEEN